MLIYFNFFFAYGKIIEEGENHRADSLFNKEHSPLFRCAVLLYPHMNQNFNKYIFSRYNTKINNNI